MTSIEYRKYHKNLYIVECGFKKTIYVYSFHPTVLTKCPTLNIMDFVIAKFATCLVFCAKLRHFR